MSNDHKKLYPSLKFKAVGLRNFLNGTSVDIIIKNKEVYNTVYLDHHRKFDTTVKEAYKSTTFFDQIKRLLRDECLVANPKQRKCKFTNGWKVFVPYNTSLIDMLKNQFVFKDKDELKNVNVETVDHLTIKYSGHLLYDLDRSPKWNETSRNYDIDYISPDHNLGNDRIPKTKFLKMFNDCGMIEDRANHLLKKCRSKPNTVCFLKLFGPSVKYETNNDESKLDTQIYDKSKEKSTSYLLSLCHRNFINSISELQSFQMKLPLPNPLMSLCRNVLDKLIMSNIDSPEGISIVTEQPMGIGLMMNISRPGVLRQYYGRNVGDFVGQTIKRATYGYKSAVGTDPDKFITKPFDNNLVCISNIIMTKLRNHNKGALCKTMNLDIPFNSCTILPYSSIPGIKEISSMGWHCDAKYSLDGVFESKKNSQAPNTPVIIVTYGNNRYLKWRRVYYGPNKHGKMVWIQDKSWVKQEMCMGNLSFLILSHADEIPKRHPGSNTPYRFEHGNIRVNKEEGFSVAFVLRIVTTFHYYDIITNIMITNVKYSVSAKDVLRKNKNDIRRKERENMYDNCQDKVGFHKTLSKQYLRIRHSE